MRISDWSSDVCSSDLSESNTGYTWAENAHEFRLTPWHDDPVSDPGGEAFYIRDEQTGRFWSPTPLPSPGRSEEHTSELQSLMRISYAVFCLKKKTITNTTTTHK